MCPAIGIDPHNSRPIVGPTAYSVGYYPGYNKERSGTEEGRSKHCRFELRIEHTYPVNSNNHLVVETIHFPLGAQQGQSSPFSGIIRWSGGTWGRDGEWPIRVDSTETGCLRAPLLSNTEALKWRMVYLPIPIIRNNTMVKGLSIPIVPNNRYSQRYIDTYR